MNKIEAVPLVVAAVFTNCSDYSIIAVAVNMELHFFIKRYKKLSKSIFSRKTIYFYAINMTYTTVGVKLVGMARYGARFVVLPPPLF